MVGTILSFLLVLLFYLNQNGSTIHDESIAIIFISVAALFILVHSLTLALAWTPLQFAEQYTTPHIFDIFKRDRYLFLTNFWLIFFPLITLILAIYTTSYSTISKALLSLWIVLLGISLDAVYFSIKRMFGYFNPFHVMTLFTREATKSIQNGQDIDLCHWIDGLSEMATRAIQRSSISLCHDALQELQTILRIFLASSKSISQSPQDSQINKLGISDRVSYILFFLLQRIEMIHDKIIAQKLEPSSSTLITTLGKMAISAAKCDITLTTYPLQCLGRASVKAQRHGLVEVGFKAECTLLEVAKTLLTDIDITYLELKETFFTLTTQLDEITKEMFRQDKTINFALLKQPFLDLKGLFKNEKASTHQDTPVILENIDRIIGDFAALEAVMRTIPPIPTTENHTET